MDKSYSFSSSELRTLLDQKRKSYSVKSFTRNGQWITHLVIQYRCTGGTAIGKLVKKSSEEFRQRPWLHQRNLAPLIDMISINDDFVIFVSDFVEKCLREIIHEEAFVSSSSCFSLKKTYIEDVLCGLSYLHRNNLCLLNLSDANVFICEEPQRNKAIITDFGSLSKKNNSDGRLAAPLIHQPPELRMADGVQCDLVAAEMWTIGMMVLEVFTQHKLPWALVDYNPDQVLDMMDKVDYGLLKVANSGSTISIHDLWEFKEFVRLFIDADPANRSSAKNATSAKFLQSSKSNLSLQKSPQKSPLRLSAVQETGSTNSPSIHKMTVDRNENSKYYPNDIHDNFKTSENPTGKSLSNVSFKKCVYPLKQNNYSDLKSNITRPSSYADWENNCHSEIMNQNDERKSKSRSMLNLDLVKEGLKANDIQFSPKIQSKISVSSQTELPDSVSKNSGIERELNTDISANVCPYKSPNEAINSFSINIQFDTDNFPPNATREVTNTTEIINESPNDLKNLSTENKISTNPPNTCFEKLNVLCDTNDFGTFEDNLLQATSDQLNNIRMMLYQNCHDDPGQTKDNKGTKKKKSKAQGKGHKSKVQGPTFKTNIGTKDSNQKDSKSTVDSKKSAFRIPVSKYRPAEQLILENKNFRKGLYEKLKFESEIASKTHSTLPKSNNSDFQNFQSTAKNNGKKTTVEHSNLEQTQKGKTGTVGKTLFTLPKSSNFDFKNFQSTAKNNGIMKNVEQSNLEQAQKGKTGTVGKTLFTLHKSSNSAFQNFQSTARNALDSMSATDDGIKKNVGNSNLEEAQQGTSNLGKEVEELNKKFTEMKPRNNCIFDLKLPSPPTIDAMNLAWQKWSDYAQTNINENRHCLFRHGCKCPIFQKAHIPQSNAAAIQVAVIGQDDKENAYEDKCQTCGNGLNDEPKVSGKLSEFPLGRPLPHEYRFPTTIHRGATNKSPIPSPNSLSHVSVNKSPTVAIDSTKIGCDTHNQVSVTPNWNEQENRTNIDEVKYSKDVAVTHRPPKKAIIVRGYTGRNPIIVERVETKQKRYVKKKVDRNSITGKKDAYKTGSTEYLPSFGFTILSDSSDEKKKSKKRSALKNCFCIGK